MPSSTVENYLKAIWAHDNEENIPVATGILATELNVTPGTVTSMLKQLEKNDLATYHARQGVLLTEKGRKAAVLVIRRHRLIETFLVEIMNLDWAEVHEEAEVLEHAVSDRLLQRMDQMLGHPSTDPHGAPIPDAEGKIQAQSCVPLSQATTGSWRIVAVDEAEPTFLSWLSQHHLHLGTHLQLNKIDAIAGLLTIQPASHQELSLSLQAAEKILVSK